MGKVVEKMVRRVLSDNIPERARPDDIREMAKALLDRLA